MTRRAFTLVEALVVVAILLTLAGLLWLPISAARSEAIQKQEDSQSNGPRATWRLWTRQHDGHWWVISPEHFQHHPDCPCMSRKAESEVK